MNDGLPDDVRAMGELASVFARLQEEDLQRVLRWANEKYRFRVSQSVPPAPRGSGAADSMLSGAGRAPEPTPEESAPSFADLPALMDATKPASGLERILVAAYFNQVLNDEGDFGSQAVNTQLKHLGFPSANITRDIARLVNRSPKLVIQTRKEGSTQQARKRFRLTNEGVKAVEGMLKQGEQAEL